MPSSGNGRKSKKSIKKDITLDTSPSKKRKNTECNLISFLNNSLVLNEEGKIKRIGMDDFKIHKVIGKGSYGKVYLVEKMMTSEENKNLMS